MSSGIALNRTDAAIVTGGGSGIGRALVGALVARGASRVIAADLDAEAAASTAALFGAAVIPATLDVADGDAVARLAEKIEAEHGPIGLWFSNAGIHTSDGLGAAPDWQRAFGVNVLAHVHAAHAVLPAMEARGEGAFVVTASAAGLLMDLRTATYTATKHAAVGLTEWLAASVADGVSIHCVCPEGVHTAMTRPDSGFAAAGLEFLSAEAVAAAILDGVERGDFLIFTHTRTAEFERRRTADRARWLGGMRRARQSTLHLDRIFSSADRTLA